MIGAENTMRVLFIAKIKLFFMWLKNSAVDIKSTAILFDL
jgi:hypothetical protein